MVGLINKLPKFGYRCLCWWSKDNKYGFIPNTACPVHGKETKDIVKKSIPYNKTKRQKILAKEEKNKW